MVPMGSSNAPYPPLSALCSSAQLHRKQEVPRPRKRPLRGDELLSLPLSAPSLPVPIRAGPTQVQVLPSSARSAPHLSVHPAEVLPGALTQPLCLPPGHLDRCAFHQSTPSLPRPRLEFTVTTKNVPDKPTRTTTPGNRARRTWLLGGEEGYRGVSREGWAEGHSSVLLDPGGVPGVWVWEWS